MHKQWETLSHYWLFIVIVWGIKTSISFFSPNHLLLQNGQNTTSTVKLLLAIALYVVVDHIHGMSVRHTYILNIIKEYINKRILPRGVTLNFLFDISWLILVPVVAAGRKYVTFCMCHMCFRSICCSKQAQDRHIFKNQMVIDICRVVLTFTINDDIFHHKFFCDIPVFHVYCRLNLIIYNINNTFFMQNITHFTKTYFLSVTIQKLQNKYYLRTSNTIGEKQGYIAIIRQLYRILSFIVLLFENTCHTELHGWYWNEIILPEDWVQPMIWSQNVALQSHKDWQPCPYVGCWHLVKQFFPVNPFLHAK